MIVLILSSLFLFCFGLTVGSFLNVVIQRNERGESLTGRSHCDTCGTILSWRELIPLISFVCQRARCRHCDTALSLQYPLVEFGTGMVFVAVGGRILSDAVLTSSIITFSNLGVLLAIASTMIVIIGADFNYHIIPNGAVLLLAILGIAVTLIRNGLTLSSVPALDIRLFLHGAIGDVAASMGAVLFLFALWYVSKGRAMGFGDVKLIGATSLLLGFPLSVLALLFSFWLGGLCGIALLLTNMRTLKSQMAFGPFIIGGTILAFFFGKEFLLFSGFYYLL